MNERIAAPTVRVIDETGTNLGVLPTARALERAAAAGLDLVEISPGESPPVCKILDYGRYKYEEQKRQASARAKQKVADLNEVKVRPNIERHDYEVKKRTIERILTRGDKVRLVVRFRGREITRQERGAEVLRRLLVDLGDTVRVEQEAHSEGRQSVMILSRRTGGGRGNCPHCSPWIHHWLDGTGVSVLF